MRTRKVLPDWQWPSWRYGPGGQSAIFQKAEDVPEGWTKKPDEVAELFIHQPAPPPLNHDELIADLLRMGVNINPQWADAHMKRIIDGDVSPTG